MTTLTQNPEQVNTGVVGLDLGEYAVYDNGELVTILYSKDFATALQDAEQVRDEMREGPLFVTVAPDWVVCECGQVVDVEDFCPNCPPMTFAEHNARQAAFDAACPDDDNGVA